MRKRPAARIDYGAAFYSRRQTHGEVNTTFVQFYPTLLPVALRKGTRVTAAVAGAPPVNRD